MERLDDLVRPLIIDPSTILHLRPTTPHHRWQATANSNHRGPLHSKFEHRICIMSEDDSRDFYHHRPSLSRPCHP